MEKVIKYKMVKTPAVTKTLSDFDNTQEACQTLVIYCGYGSNHDMCEFKLDLDNQMLEKLLKYLDRNLPDDKSIYDFRSLDL